MDSMDRAALHCADKYSTQGKSHKRPRSTDDYHLQPDASTTIRQTTDGLLAYPGIGRKDQLRMQHFMPLPAVLSMYQPFLRQLAAGIAAGLAAGRDSSNKDGECAPPPAAAATMPELQLPVLQEAGIDIITLFQPMVQMMMTMTAGAHSASIQHSKAVRAASHGMSTSVQANTAGTSVGTVADRPGKKARGQTAHLVASKGAAAKVPFFYAAEPAAAEDVTYAAVASAGAAAAAAADNEAVGATDELQLQHPFVSSPHCILASPDAQQQQQPQQLPAGTWMSASSSSAVSSSWAGPAAETKSPTTSITGMPPGPASTSSKQQQSSQQQQGLLSPIGLQLTGSGNIPWAVSPSCSANAANAGGASAAGSGATTAAVGGVRVAPGPEDSHAINSHRQHILLLERQLGNMHPEVGQAYLSLAQALTQEGSMWSLAMAERAHKRAAQIVESLRQRTAANNASRAEAAAAVPGIIASRGVACGAVAVLDAADAYVYVNANRQGKGAAA